MSDTALPINGSTHPTSQKAFSASKGSAYNGRSRIGLLCGNDISTLILLNSVVPKLVQAGFNPVLYMAEHRPSKKEAAQQHELQTLSFYERYLPNNVIFPVLEQLDTPRNPDGSPRKDILYTPTQLAEVYELDLASIPDINAKEFVDHIAADDSMALLISVRCYQIAHTPLIEAQKHKEVSLHNDRTDKGGFWNLHPGKLPEYQGIFGPLYAMNDLQRTYAWTLHEVIYEAKDKHKGIDKGPVITQTTDPIDYTRPALNLYTGFAKRGASMLYDRIEDHFRNGAPTTPQAEYKDGEQEQYFSHPEPEFFSAPENWPSIWPRLIELGDKQGFKVDSKIRELVAKGNTKPEIVNFAEVIEDLPSRFVKPKANAYDVLYNAVERAVFDWEQHGELYVEQHRDAHPDSQVGIVDHLLVTGKRLPNGFKIPNYTPSPQVYERAINSDEQQHSTPKVGK